MKKTVFSAVICLVLLLCACSDVSSIEDLLRAPELTADQKAVKAALEAEIGESPSFKFKYPISGDRRAPIQFVDLDGDEINEAVVFFATADIPVAQIAVLKNDGPGKWVVKKVLPGLDSNVESINYLRLENNPGRLILVEWSSSATARERKLSPYRFENGDLVSGVEENSSNLLVYDLDSDSYDEFLYITATANGYALKYVDPSDGSGNVEPIVLPLNSDMNGCLGLTAGLLKDGTSAVFIDESIRAGAEPASTEEKAAFLQITEVFVFANGRLMPAQTDYDIAALSLRPDTAPTCRRLDDKSNFVYIPSVNKPSENIASDQWTYWYTISDGVFVPAFTTYVDQTYNFALAVPDNWLAGVSVVHEDRSMLWEVYGLGESEPVISLLILPIGDSDLIYKEQGYNSFAQRGAYRFLLKGIADEEDMAYIIKNFIIL